MSDSAAEYSAQGCGRRCGETAKPGLSGFGCCELKIFVVEVNRSLPEATTRDENGSEQVYSTSVAG